MQRIIGIGFGAIVTYILLVAFAGAGQSQVYLTAVTIGLVIAIVWPWFINLVVARRVKERRREEVDREVEARLANTVRPASDRVRPE